MGRTIYPILLTLLLSALAGCKTEEDYRRAAEQLRNSIPDEYRRTGMISSSTYQVYFRITARSDSEALDLARSECEPLALRYLLKEPFIYVTISPYGVQRLKDLIHKKGRIITVHRAENQEYEVVYHITDYGLREQFQQIR
jgi:hypothetical protein